MLFLFSAKKCGRPVGSKVLEGNTSDTDTEDDSILPHAKSEKRRKKGKHIFKKISVKYYLYYGVMLQSCDFGKKVY